MGNKPEYTVSFGEIARTLVYEDSQGALLFTFEVGPAKDSTKGKWDMHLDRRPLTADLKMLVATKDSDHKRSDTAVLRTADYAQSCGYVVVVSQ
jgi:hypothetical protein